MIKQPPRRRRARRYAASSARFTPEVPAKVSETRVSVSSERRITSGRQPVWASERRVSRPEAKSAAIQASWRRASGAGRTRTPTSVITPSTPSEPSASSRSDGPAAVCGVASVRSGPLGVCIASEVTSSSKRP